MSPTNLDARAWETTLEAAKANTLASSTAMVAHLNRELKARYDSQFDSWRTMVMAGKIDNSNPPKPPVGYELQANEQGFMFYALGTAPVCSERTDIPPDYSKPAIQVLPEPDHVRGVPAGDTAPVGFIMTAADGTRWQKQSSVTPFGVAYFYARVAWVG